MTSTQTPPAQQRRFVPGQPDMWAFVLFEAGLSFLGLGIKLPTASWGNLLADAPNFYSTRPLLMVWPGIALLLTTLAFNLFGDGLRDAFDPRLTR